MEFQEKIKQFASKVPELINNARTEEATKMSLIMPFFSLLGYNIFDPTEFCPEFTADVGIKKKEKVDFAILNDSGEPIILIECKPSSEKLDRHGSQLFRYFSTTTAKFAILTNGVEYRFFTDLDEINKMDSLPFMVFDMLNLKESLISELQKFEKQSYDPDMIFSIAEELKYSALIKEYLKSEMDNPSEDFVKDILSHIYDGARTQKIIDKYTPLVKRAFISFINDIVNQKISLALSVSNDEDNPEDTQTNEKPLQKKSKIITTEEELESYYIIRGILAGTVPLKDIAHRDTESYFGILYKDNNRKPICRVLIGANTKQLLIPDENKVFNRHYIKSLDEIYKYKNDIIEVAKRYIYV